MTVLSDCIGLMDASVVVVSVHWRLFFNSVWKAVMSTCKTCDCHYCWFVIVKLSDRWRWWPCIDDSRSDLELWIDHWIRKCVWLVDVVGLDRAIYVFDCTVSTLLIPGDTYRLQMMIIGFQTEKVLIFHGLYRSLSLSLSLSLSFSFSVSFIYISLYEHFYFVALLRLLVNHYQS